jgi:hypothetical protein
MQSKYSCRFLARAASLLSALGGAYPFTRFTALQFLTWSEWNIILLLKKCLTVKQESIMGNKITTFFVLLDQGPQLLKQDTNQ